MGERALARAQRNDQEVREYVRAATGATAKASPAEDLSRLADLRKNGDITQGGVRAGQGPRAGVTSG